MTERDKKYASVRKALQEIRLEQSETGVPEPQEEQEEQEEEKSPVKKPQKAIADESLYESSDATFDSLFLTKGAKSVDDQVPQQLQEDLSQQVSKEIEKVKKEPLSKPPAKKKTVKTSIGPTQVLPEVNLRRKRKQAMTKEMDADELFESKILPKEEPNPPLPDEPPQKTQPDVVQQVPQETADNKVWWGVALCMIFLTFILALSMGSFSSSPTTIAKVKSQRAFVDDLTPEISTTGMVISFNSNFLLETQIAQKHYFAAKKKGLTIVINSRKFSGRFRDAFEVIGTPGNFSLKVRITLLGKTNLLQPGLVEAKIMFPKEKDCLQVPRQAVLLQRDFAGKLYPVVFRLERQKSGYTTFVTAVVLGTYNDEYVEIKKGLKEDTLVATGLANLKNLKDRSIVALISD